MSRLSRRMSVCFAAAGDVPTRILDVPVTRVGQVVAGKPARRRKISVGEQPVRLPPLQLK